MVVGGREQTKLPTHNFEGEGKGFDDDEMLALETLLALRRSPRTETL